jgi:hypothetical protein
MNYCHTHGTFNVFIIELLRLHSKSILPQPIVVNGEQEYEVEKILNSRYHIINYNI